VRDNDDDATVIPLPKPDDDLIHDERRGLDAITRPVPKTPPETAKD
jgi:hypothetical protein